MKSIIVIDDKPVRLEARQHDIERAGYADSVDFRLTAEFVKVDESANPIVEPTFLDSGVKCIFIHTSLKEGSRFPESIINKVRTIVKPILVVGFSGGTNTQLTVPKLSYEDFERGLLTFTQILADYEVLYLRIFEGAGISELSVYFSEEVKKLLQPPHKLSIVQVIESIYFKNLLKCAGTSFSDFLRRYDPASLKPIELARICIQLSKQ